MIPETGKTEKAKLWLPASALIACAVAVALSASVARPCALADEPLSSGQLLEADTEIVLDYVGCDLNEIEDHIRLRTDYVLWGDVLGSGSPEEEWVESNAAAFEGWNLRAWSAMKLEDANRVVITYYYWRNLEGLNEDVFEHIDELVEDDNSQSDQEVIELLQNPWMMLADTDSALDGSFSGSDSVDASASTQRDGADGSGAQNAGEAVGPDDGGGEARDGDRASSAAGQGETETEAETETETGAFPLWAVLVGALVVVGSGVAVAFRGRALRVAGSRGTKRS